MKLFSAALGAETNTFVDTETTLKDFEDCLLWRPGAEPLGPSEFAATNWVAREWARKGEGRQLVEGTCAHACPGGVTTREAYESLRDEILAQLAAAAPVDGVLLSMHGAMIADGYLDCEGDLLERVRAIVGDDTVVGTVLDLHCHLTERMLNSADIIITFKEYPHTDYIERAEELVRLVEKTAMRKIRPTSSVFDCRMIDAFHTTQEPMASLLEEVRELEKTPGILSISIVHSFPWGDVEDIGAKILVFTDAEPERGEILARDIGLRLFSLRGRARDVALTLDEALDIAVDHVDERIVIADTSDNPGGGAPGDTVHFLKAILNRGIGDACIGPIYDPECVALSFAHGLGAELNLKIGGKAGRFSGEPAAIRGTVVGLRAKATQRFASTVVQMGDTAAIDCQGVRIVLTAQRVQGFSPDLFRCVGVEPLEHQIVVVKSSQHFRDAFAQTADRIVYAKAPGLLDFEANSLQYSRLKRRLWPIHELDETMLTTPTHSHS